MLSLKIACPPPPHPPPPTLQLVYDFDEFMKIPNCARGRHNADPDGTEGYGKSNKKK